METPFAILEKLRQAHVRLSEGMLPGGCEELNRHYPDRVKEIDDELHNNMTVEGVDRYEKRLTEGLRRIGRWKG